MKNASLSVLLAGMVVYADTVWRYTTLGHRIRSFMLQVETFIVLRLVWV